MITDKRKTARNFVVALDVGGLFYVQQYAHFSSVLSFINKHHRSGIKLKVLRIFKDIYDETLGHTSRGRENF